MNMKVLKPEFSVPSISTLREIYYPENDRKIFLHRVMEVNKPYIEKRIDAYKKRCEDRPLVGEFFINKKGEYERFTHAWSDGIQVGASEKNSGFYFTDLGGCSYSGGLDPAIEYEKFKLTSEIKNGRVWSFDRNRCQAFNAVYYDVPFRVWILL